ncbi:urea ABC transporter ATP-binding subunit UrtE [Pontiella sp.]|uniref:urea ABC transporter ATP-binding subunit UrtE n=1 Tax=Pontiella sp. TaxID=2837462 RepID=UPI003569148F
MLNIDKMSFSYGGVQALFEVTMGVPAGEIVCIMGRNGVGKTTLVRNIMGLLSLSFGSVTFNGTDISVLPPHKRVRQGMAYVPQGRQIFPRLTVEENLRTGLASKRDEIPADVFEYFPVLDEMRSRMGGDLSGGQQQQLAIARALVTRPKLLILDEPTEGIQPNIIQRIGEVLRSLSREQGMTILIVEQYLDFVKEFSDRFVLMNRGRVVAADEITHLREELVEEYLHV